MTATKNFTMKEIKSALKGAGPKTTDNIIKRLINEGQMTFEELVEIENFVEKEIEKRRAQR